MEVIIDDVYGNILYESYYIYGLLNLAGNRNVRFSSEPFMTLQNVNDRMNVFLFKVDDKRYAISYCDSYEINEAVYDWCDVYGSVNANFSKTPERFRGKLVSLCPSFGIRCWNYFSALLHASKGLFQSGKPCKKYLGKYKRMLQRPLYQDYFIKNPSNNNNNYIFFLSTLWFSDEWNRNDEGVNVRRANFIRACKELDNVQFEGGLVSQGRREVRRSYFAIVYA